MKPSHIEHIGVAVENLESSVRFYEKVLGLNCYNIELVTDQKVKTAFFLVGDTKIELLQPIEPDSPVARFIEKRGEGIHHIAFAVNDLTEALNHAEKEGVQLIDHVPRKGAEGLNIAFLHPRSASGVLIELCEAPDRGQK